MLYNSSVILFNENKYGEIVLQNVVNELYKYTSFDGKEWICRLCHIALSRNNVPIQAKANGLELDAIPNELKDLNTLELRLISLKMVDPLVSNDAYMDQL